MTVLTGAGVVLTGVSFGADAVTVWVTAGAVLMMTVWVVPHAASPRPAANAMAGIATSLIFILSSPENVLNLSRSPPGPEGHHGQRSVGRPSRTRVTPRIMSPRKPRIPPSRAGIVCPGPHPW